MPSARPARIEPLPTSELAGLDWAALSLPDPGPPASNIIASLCRHWPLFARWRPFTAQLLSGRLPPRSRELLVLRTAWRCSCEYVWGHHLDLAQAAGLTEAEIERVKQDGRQQQWSALDMAVLSAADELHDDGCIGDETWRMLSSTFSDDQMIEVPMVVGHYHTISFTMNSLGVRNEPGYPGFARPDATARPTPAS